jgi:hypothetical protein
MSMETVISRIAPQADLRPQDSFWARRRRPIPGFSLPEALKNSLHEAPQGFRQKLAALEKEVDPEIRSQGFYLLGLELRGGTRLEAAVALFSWLEREAGGRSEPWARELGTRARRAREAVVGCGSFAERVEFQISHLADSRNAVWFAGFGFGALVADAVKLASVSRMAAAAPRWIAQGWRANFAASSLAFAAEAPALVAVQQGLSRAWGMETEGFWTQLEHSLLPLGAMRLTNFAALRRSPWLQQTAMLGGTYLTQRIQGMEHPTALVDSLAFLFPAQLGASLSRQVFGNSLARRLAYWREALHSPRSTRPESSIASPALDWAAAGGRGGGDLKPSRSSLEISQAQIVLAQGTRRDSNGPFLQRRVVERLQERSSFPARSAERVAEDFSSTPLGSETSRSYLELLAGVHVENMSVGKENFTKGTILERAVAAFRHVKELNTVETTTGSLYEHLLQWALEITLAAQDQGRFNDLVQLAGFTRTIQGLETFLGAEAPIRPFLPGPHIVRLARVNLPPALGELIFDYLRVLDIPMGRDRAGNPWERDRALGGLENYIRAHPPESEGWNDLCRALERVRVSPARMILLDRILKVLAHGGFPEKLREIYGMESFDLLSMYESKTFDPLNVDFESLGPLLNGTIYTGFVDDLPLASKIAEIYSLLPLYVRHEQHNIMETIGFARKRLEDKKTAEPRNRGLQVVRDPLNYQREDVLELLFHRHADLPVAARAREAVLNEEVDLQVLSRERMEELWGSTDHGEKDRAAPYAFYVPASKSVTSKPLIAVRELDPSEENKPAHAVYLPARVSNEYQHHLDLQEFPFDSRRGLPMTERRGRLAELHFLIAHGYFGEWRTMEDLSPYGLGLYLRTEIEQDLPFPQP